MVRTCRGWLAVGVLMGVVIPAALAEDVQVTTYYPAPRGRYEELQTTNNTALAVQGGGVGIGTTAPLADPNAKLEIQGGNLNIIVPNAAAGTRGLHIYEGSAALANLRVATRASGGVSGVGVFYTDTGKPAGAFTAQTQALGANIQMCSPVDDAAVVNCNYPGGGDARFEVRETGEIIQRAPLADVHILNGDVVTTKPGTNQWLVALWSANAGHNGMGVYYDNGRAVGGFDTFGTYGGLYMCPSTATDNFCEGGAAAVWKVYAPSGDMLVKGTSTFDGPVKITSGTPALGEVLTSDATGLATWQPAGGGAPSCTRLATNCGFAGCVATVTCAAGEKIVSGMGCNLTRWCDNNPQLATVYCAAGGNTCSVVAAAASPGAGVSVYCCK